MMEKGVLQSIQEAGSLFFGPLWSFVVAFLAIVVGIIVSRYAQRLIRAALGWTSMGETTIFTNLVRIIIALLVAIFISDTVFHVKLTVFAQTLGISALIVSLGLQDLVKNIVAGIQIVGGHLFSAGDQLEVGDVRGEVMDVSWRQTVLRDKDNNTHVLPNAALMSEAFMRRESKMIDRYTIDCDINLLSDGKYHMLIKKEGGKPGIYTATSDHLTYGWGEPGVGGEGLAHGAQQRGALRGLDRERRQGIGAHLHQGHLLHHERDGRRDARHRPARLSRRLDQRRSHAGCVALGSDPDPNTRACRSARASARAWGCSARARRDRAGCPDRCARRSCAPGGSCPWPRP